MEVYKYLYKENGRGRRGTVGSLLVYKETGMAFWTIGSLLLFSLFLCKQSNALAMSADIRSYHSWLTSSKLSAQRPEATSGMDERFSHEQQVEYDTKLLARIYDNDEKMRIVKKLQNERVPIDEKLLEIRRMNGSGIRGFSILEGGLMRDWDFV
jgi:hypothetical protein